MLFSDIVGSTALGESLDPETLRVVLSRYFASMEAVLERHGGTVEKFIGDAIMAVFGLRTIHEDDALRAVRAALEMRDALAALNVELLRRARRDDRDPDRRPYRRGRRRRPVRAPDARHRRRREHCRAPRTGCRRPARSWSGRRRGGSSATRVVVEPRPADRGQGQGGAGPGRPAAVVAASSSARRPRSSRRRSARRSRRRARPAARDVRPGRAPIAARRARDGARASRRRQEPTGRRVPRRGRRSGRRSSAGVACRTATGSRTGRCARSSTRPPGSATTTRRRKAQRKLGGPRRVDPGWLARRGPPRQRHRAERRGGPSRGDLLGGPPDARAPGRGPTAASLVIEDIHWAETTFLELLEQLDRARP